MIRLLIIHFLRSRSHLSALVLLFLSGLLSLYMGRLFLEKQHDIVQKTMHAQQESIARHVQFSGKEMGLLLYYLRFGYVHTTPALAALSMGQRDVHPSVMSVTIRNLEEQTHNTDLVNPLHLLWGNLDFSFVLVYFFPLVIIALGYNLVSEEKEKGTWSLILSQASSPIKVLRTKLLIRYVSVVGVLLLLLGISLVYIPIPPDASFVAFSGTAVLYLTFWFSLVWLVVSFHQSSSQNAVWLLTTWVVLMIVVPALSNVAIALAWPVPETFQTLLAQREGYHAQWDKPKEPTLKKFYAHYPQFRAYTHPKNHSFSWLWYYAMQQMGDDESARQSAELRQKLVQREKASQYMGLFFPGMHTQLTLSALSQSGLDNHLRFLAHLKQFHEQKRLYFYPKIFADIPPSRENWKQFQVAYFQPPADIHWLKAFLPLVCLSVVCLIGAQKISKNSSF